MGSLHDNIDDPQLLSVLYPDERDEVEATLNRSLVKSTLNVDSLDEVHLASDGTEWKIYPKELLGDMDSEEIGDGVQETERYLLAPASSGIPLPNILERNNMVEIVEPSISGKERFLADITSIESGTEQLFTIYTSNGVERASFSVPSTSLSQSEGKFLNAVSTYNGKAILSVAATPAVSAEHLFVTLKQLEDRLDSTPALQEYSEKGNFSVSVCFKTTETEEYNSPHIADLVNHFGFTPPDRDPMNNHLIVSMDGVDFHKNLLRAENLIVSDLVRALKSENKALRDASQDTSKAKTPSVSKKA